MVRAENVTRSKALNPFSEGLNSTENHPKTLAKTHRNQASGIPAPWVRIPPPPPKSVNRRNIASKSPVFAGLFEFLGANFKNGEIQEYHARFRDLNPLQTFLVVLIIKTPIRLNRLVGVFFMPIFKRKEDF